MNQGIWVMIKSAEQVIEQSTEILTRKIAHVPNQGLILGSPASISQIHGTIPASRQYTGVKYWFEHPKWTEQPPSWRAKFQMTVSNQTVMMTHLLL